MEQEAQEAILVRRSKWLEGEVGELFEARRAAVRFRSDGEDRSFPHKQPLQDPCRLHQ